MLGADMLWRAFSEEKGPSNSSKAPHKNDSSKSIRRRVLTGLERLPVIRIIVDHLGKEGMAPHADLLLPQAIAFATQAQAFLSTWLCALPPIHDSALPRASPPSLRQLPEVRDTLKYTRAAQHLRSEDMQAKKHKAYSNV